MLVGALVAATLLKRRRSEAVPELRLAATDCDAPHNEALAESLAA